MTEGITYDFKSILEDINLVLVDLMVQLDYIER
ncbi:Uncharacterised protein [Bacteroides uniformis]|uniref:Uncharacterized protein n=1 Tax=Bacteroides uniformis TaxID=820 RepID=A0A174S1D4_BACUN|nr:Uncharacterised protein [Bacteroides uniformis]